MPWEKSFVVDDAIDRAKGVFWERGYQGTSIADLLDVTGLKRGSLYNAFGGKQELFIKALLKYEKENCNETLARFAQYESPREAITSLFSAVVDQALKDEHKRGCFIVNTALEIQTHDNEVQSIVKAAMRDFEKFFEQLIERGQVQSEFSKELDAKGTAKALLGLLVGLRVLSRGVFDKAGLKAIAGRADQLLVVRD